MSKEIRSILNRVSEGNVEVMFTQLKEVVEKYIKKDRETFLECYSQIFMQLNVGLQQNMSAILSVNCAYISALQRTYGEAILTKVVRCLYDSFENEARNDKMRMKNILNCLLHLFVFQSMTGTLLVEMIKILIQAYSENDIEILIFILHNIGLQLRKEDPASVKEIIDLQEQKKNTYLAEAKMT